MGPHAQTRRGVGLLFALFEPERLQWCLRDEGRQKAWALLSATCACSVAFRPPVSGLSRALQSLLPNTMKKSLSRGQRFFLGSGGGTSDVLWRQQTDSALCPGQL